MSPNRTEVVLKRIDAPYHYLLSQIVIGNVEIGSYKVEYPIFRIAQNALHFNPWQTGPIKHHFNLSGKHPATLLLIRADYSYTSIHHCI